MENMVSCQYLKNDGHRFDVLKFGLAILVVLIHTSQQGMFFRPILRVAVPLFFLMTSYFFFAKQASLNTGDEKKKGLQKYVKRTLWLYAFWFVALLPLTIYYRNWGGVNLIILRDFLLGSTFKASWFLMASLIDVILVWAMSRTINDKWLLAIGFLAYLLCCLSSNYYYLSIGVLPSFEVCRQLFNPVTSFLVAFLFVVTGKILAENPIYVSNKHLALIIAFSAVALCGEFLLVRNRHWDVSDDCFICLIPLCIAVFLMIGQNDFTIDMDSKVLRNYSTITYCFHASFAPIIGQLLVWSGFVKGAWDYTSLKFIATLALSLTAGWLILRSEKKKRLGWLKYSH